MYITTITHFLDDSWNIPKQMPREARELASFFALVIDTTTKISSSTLTPTYIRCFESGCLGTIRSELVVNGSEIHWKCSKCQNEGRISHWQKTRWNNNRKNKE